MQKEAESIFDEVGDEGYVGTKFQLAPEKRTKPLSKKHVSELIGCGKMFYSWGWAPLYNDQGSSGNLGFRAGDGIAVTATNRSLGDLIEEDIMKITNVDYLTEPPTIHYEESEDRQPTSETLAHWEIFKKRSDVNVILHGHDPLTTERAKLLERYAPTLVGRTEENLPYGTKEFAYALRDVLDDDKVYLISQGHGFFSLGKNFKEALYYADVAHTVTSGFRLATALRYPWRSDMKLPLLDGLARIVTDRLSLGVKIGARFGAPDLARAFRPLVRAVIR